MRVRMNLDAFVYHFEYESDESHCIHKFPAHEAIVEYILSSLVLLLTGELVKWFTYFRLDYEDGILIIEYDGHLSCPKTAKIGLADHYNPLRYVFLSGVSALLELAEFQVQQAHSLAE